MKPERVAQIREKFIAASNIVPHHKYDYDKVIFSVADDATLLAIEAEAEKILRKVFDDQTESWYDSGNV